MKEMSPSSTNCTFELLTSEVYFCLKNYFVIFIIVTTQTTDINVEFISRLEREYGIQLK